VTIEKARLTTLIEFAQQAARLRGRPAASVATHGLFSLYEHEIQGLPGIKLNLIGPDGDDERWLALERLHEAKPPQVTSSLLVPWLHLAATPFEEPRLREAVNGATLIDAGTHDSAANPGRSGKPVIDPTSTVLLSDYELAPQVRSQFSAYAGVKWRAWAEEEKLRRKSIRLYSQLFTLKQELEGSIVEAQLECVWGVGLGIWSSSGASVCYPLVGRLVEISLNPVTAEIQVRPRDVDARIEVDWYASVDNPGVASFEKAAKEFFEKATTTFSPFDPATFEPLLRTAASHLDANGKYWPTEVAGGDRTLPKADDKLKVTDTWVLFARPRTNSVYLQDLEKLKKKVQEAELYPPAISAVVTDPETTNPDIELPSFRGVSATSYYDSGTATTKERDLFFPKPFNDEQVRIVQLLDMFDGVVAQGPPGTGKTHTIANVICHYLAEGKRVLVTSMKDPALRVLQDHLPPEIRPLAISLLTSEQDGMKQFEHSINKIASEVQSLDRSATSRAITHLQGTIDSLHSRLTYLDRKIADWASRNLTKIDLDGESADPQDAARELVRGIGEFEWLPDPLGVGSEFSPKFSDSDVVLLREARRVLGKDIDYLGASLPELAELPDAREVLKVHQDLSQFTTLKRQIDTGSVPSLPDSTKETIDVAEQLHAQIEIVEQYQAEIARANRDWTRAIHDRLHRGHGDDQLVMFEALGGELESAMEARRAFLKKPVEVPNESELDAELHEAVQNLVDGRSAFGIRGLFGKSKTKSRLERIRVLGRVPTDSDSWAHVGKCLEHRRQLRELAVRWNAIATELRIETVEEDVSGGEAAATAYRVYVTLKRTVLSETKLRQGASRMFPGWHHAKHVASSAQSREELGRVLRHHLAKSRLANVWAIWERFHKTISGRNGRVINEFEAFFVNKLGNPEVNDGQVQSSWSALVAELRRIASLRTHLNAVDAVCGLIAASGAPQYAAILKQPIEGSVDSALPGNWRNAWRLRRLATYLDSIDPKDELKGLAGARQEVEADLSRCYHDIVVKRTWLKLAENASPSIRAALQAYLNAIQKIGKGTGKRAVRYRHDARTAASQANTAVPCWIMPHYRVSESLPAELGCFDLLVIDEASQSDLTALPALLRSTKALIVGDDKQVSPEGVGLEEEKIRSLMNRFLDNQVDTYRSQMSPDRSIYDLFKVVFAKSSVMLKEHFRCVPPIIEYSKREFYNHELRPLRIPKGSERLDPPLIDVVVEDGYRKGDVNVPEATFIVDEIKKIISDPKLSNRTIGVVSLLADKQAFEVWQRLAEEIGPELIQQHRIACGDARTFQGKERNIMFLSMVSAPNDVGAPLSRATFEQRFNVAASRAMDRMYLVRSVGPEHLSSADRLRRGLISHFAAPFAQDEQRAEDLRKLCESPFEREMYDELVQRGYLVTPQIRVGQYRIDLVVEGHNDARLAIECDGDQYHGADKWADDMRRQRVLERAGWVFWRCFASVFIRRRAEVIAELLAALNERGIEPIGGESAGRSVHTEQRLVLSTNCATELPDREPEPKPDPDPERERGQEIPPRGFPSSPDVVARAQTSEVRRHSANPQVTKATGSDAPAWSEGEPQVPRPFAESQRGDVYASRRVMSNETADVESSAPRGHSKVANAEYVSFGGTHANDPRVSDLNTVSNGICQIIEVEGPMVAKRAYDLYLRGCGIQRMGHELKREMNKALAHAMRQGRVVNEIETEVRGYLYSVVRMKGTPPIKIRKRGPRSFDEIPPSEIQAVARLLIPKNSDQYGGPYHLRTILEHFDLKRLTTQVNQELSKILSRNLPHVDQHLSVISDADQRRGLDS
jgi:very-short-patch-repair endonuclease